MGEKSKEKKKYFTDEGSLVYLSVKSFILFITPPLQYLIFDYLPARGLINLGIDPLRLRYYTRYFRQCTVISFSLIKYGNHMLSIIVDRFTQHKSLFFTAIMKTTKPALRGEIGSHSGTLTTGTFDEK